MKPLSAWTPAELRYELDRIDRMRLPLSGATMMRRNELANELETRPRARHRRPVSMAPVLAMRADIAARKAANR